MNSLFFFLNYRNLSYLDWLVGWLADFEGNVCKYRLGLAVSQRFCEHTVGSKRESKALN